jgi:hypothetical protein
MWTWGNNCSFSLERKYLGFFDPNTKFKNTEAQFRNFASIVDFCSSIYRHISA